MNNGILLVAFGEQYDRFAAHCMAYSRKQTGLPICVLTNLEESDRCQLWQTIPGVEFIVLPWSQYENRKAKTTMNEYTPFKKTLYLDCDAIIQKKGIEKVFDMISGNNLVLNVYGRWNKDKNVKGLYLRAFAMAAIALPVTVYYGAFVGFCDSPETREFFNMWNYYWVLTGRGREMPALTCAANNSACNRIELTREDGIFSWLPANNIIQHEYGQYVRKLVGCPDFKSFKPFDKPAVLQ